MIYTKMKHGNKKPRSRNERVWSTWCCSKVTLCLNTLSQMEQANVAAGRCSFSCFLISAEVAKVRKQVAQVKVEVWLL